ncbi:MAG: hypothetical protein AB1410_10160 [Acidobacteriota bacterium]
MAFITIEKNKGHLIERMIERCWKSGGEAEIRTPLTEPDAENHIKRIKEKLESQTPKDWRFTRSPVAKFLIWDEITDCRIVGRTYRNVGNEFIEILRNPELFENRDQKEVISQITDEYLKIIRKPDSEIHHELKTIYGKGQEITELKHSYRLARIFLPHIIPLDARRIATRPNAIITKEGELWVRQNELLNIRGEENEYLLFEKLNPEGIDKSKVRIYLFDKKGNINLDQTFERSSRPIILSSHNLPNHLRSASYWSLPIYMDAEYMDLKFKQKNHLHKLSSEEALLIFRIEMLYSEVINNLKLSLTESLIPVIERLAILRGN